MAEFKLAALAREETGKGPARRLRVSGRVPAVLYGHGMAPKHLTVDAREFSHALHTDAGRNVLIELQIDGTRHLTLPKQIQRHPVRGNPTHIDFLVVQRGEKVVVAVPIHLVGDAPGVVQGGMIQQELYQVHAEAEVTSVPEAFEADISALDIGDVVHVRDLRPPAGVTITDDPDAPVVSVVPPALPEEEEPVGEDEGEEASKPPVPEVGEDSAEA